MWFDSSFFSQPLGYDFQALLGQNNIVTQTVQDSIDSEIRYHEGLSITSQVTESTRIGNICVSNVLQYIIIY